MIGGQEMSSDNDITIETATPEDWDEVYTMFSGALNFDGDPSNPAAGLEFAAWNRSARRSCVAAARSSAR